MMLSALKKTAGILLCFFLLSGVIFGQTSASSETGSIPDSLFDAGQYRDHPDVPFIYSLKDLYVTFQEDGSSIVAVLKYHVREKIFDASAKRAALVGIPYYFANNLEQVTDIQGYTYQSPDKRVPLDKNKIRTINLNSRYNVKEFTMPDVKDGSVIDYTYTIRRRYIEELPDFYLSHRVPTKRAEVTIRYPKYLRYKGVVQNYPGYVDHFITKIDTSSHEPKIFTYPQPPPIVKETWRALNIPAVKKEKYISTLDDYRGKIKFQLSKFGIPLQSLENSWDYVAAEIRRKQQVNKRIKTDRDARKLGQQIAQARPDKKAAMDSIFEYLNQKVRYSGSKAPFSKMSAKAVLRGKPANQAAINQTLTAMLQGAGIEAHPLLISTRKSGRINRSFPSLFQFNGQLAWSKIDGKTYFMDASFAHSQPNLIPVNTFNEAGLLLKPHSYQWIDIQPDKSAFSLNVTVDAALNRQGDLSGALRVKSAGYPAQKIRKKQAAGVSSSEIIRQAVLDGYSRIHLSKTKISKANDYGQPTEVSSHFTLKDYAVSFKHGLQFRPMVVGYLENNPFNDTTRHLPITLDAPEHLNLSFNIQLPDRMSLKKQPEDQTIRLPGAILKARYHIDGRTLRYTFHIDIYRKDFSTDLYPRLFNFYQHWAHLSHMQWFAKE